MYKNHRNYQTGCRGINKNPHKNGYLLHSFWIQAQSLSKKLQAHSSSSLFSLMWQAEKQYKLQTSINYMLRQVRYKIWVLTSLEAFGLLWQICCSSRGNSIWKPTRTMVHTLCQKKTLFSVNIRDFKAKLVIQMLGKMYCI